MRLEKRKLTEAVDRHMQHRLLKPALTGAVWPERIAAAGILLEAV
jgi:hypothetical protein